MDSIKGCEVVIMNKVEGIYIWSFVSFFRYFGGYKFGFVERFWLIFIKVGLSCVNFFWNLIVCFCIFILVSFFCLFRKILKVNDFKFVFICNVFFIIYG